MDKLTFRRGGLGWTEDTTERQRVAQQLKDCLLQFHFTSRIVSDIVLVHGVGVLCPRVCLCIACVQCPQRPEEGVGSIRKGMTGCSEPPCRCWDPNTALEKSRWKRHHPLAFWVPLSCPDSLPLLPQPPKKLGLRPPKKFLDFPMVGILWRPIL